MNRFFVSLILLVGVMSAFAGTSIIKFTNSTLDTLHVSVQMLSQSPLSEGDYWQPLAEEIPPLETREILSFSRDSGLENNAEYEFITRVSGTNSHVLLKQKIKGTLLNSQMWLGAEGEDFASDWQYDREIHRYETTFDGASATLAFKSEFTGGFDHISYILQPDQALVADEGPNNFKILSYNVWATTVMGSKEIDARFSELPKHFKGYDAIVFSELIDTLPSQQLLDAIRDEFPYQTAVLNSPGYLVNGGVAIVSRWPIQTEDKVIYKGVCVDIQCLASRGAVYAKINKQGNLYHVFGTHTQSYNEDEQRAVRLEQLRLMGEFVKSRQIPADEPVLMAGDYNVNKLLYPEDLAQMLINLDAVEPANEGNPYTYHGDQNHWADAGWIEYLDYVLYSQSHLTPIASVNRVIVPRSLNEALWGKWDLSDHFALVGDFWFANHSIPAEVAFPYLGEQVRLKTDNGHFMRAMLGGNSFISAGSDKNGTWESFVIESRGNNRIALRAYDGHYVSLDSWLFGTLKADADTVGDRETFELVSMGGQRVALKASNGRYLRADFGGGAGLTANGWGIGSWETFTLLAQ
ncbi:MAG: endonuclease/exonuclease/phosphatase family protein [Hahellaceae bacterium]|nr:endonuclease/exonuclease/phosphatase family protein [Hahellaceae bacterium]